MPIVCAVVGCLNNWAGLQRWREGFCKIHGFIYGVGQCICDPPYQLHPFPTEARDLEARKRWTKNINRKEVKTGKIWQPGTQSRVC